MQKRKGFDRKMKRASRASIPPFYVMQALSRAQKLAAGGQDIVHLSLGQPSARPPQQVLDKVSRMALSDSLGYTESAGLPALRTRIAQHYDEQYGIEVSPQQVFVTVGSSAAYMLALLCAFDAGDKVALAAPHYPASPNMMQALGIEPVILRCGSEQNYQPTLAQLEALREKPDGLVIASPSNPAGTVMDSGELSRVAAYCEREGIRIISDEIYHGVTFDEVRAETILRFSDQMIVTNSFSKYYLLPGWRLGWCVLPEALHEAAEAILQNFFISPPSLSQYAALEAMQHRSALDDVVHGYNANRKILLAALSQMGFTKIAPAQGAFYLYVDVRHLGRDSADLCDDLLYKAGVCAVPGRDFDKQDGQHFMRLSYAGSPQDIAVACERLQRYFAANNVGSA